MSKGREFQDRVRKNLLKDADIKPIKRKKQKLDESTLGVLPSKKMFSWNEKTGKFDKPEVWAEEKLNEYSYSSDIIKSWDTTDKIYKDLVTFIVQAHDAAGEDLVRDIYNALVNAAKYAKKKM